MMNRRSFLQALGLGLVGSTTIGKLIQSVPQKPSVPEFELTLESQPVVAKTRKLKAVWTVDLEQDLQVFHGIDAEREMAMLIQKEIDREILNSIRAAAA